MVLVQRPQGSSKAQEGTRPGKKGKIKGLLITGILCVKTVGLIVIFVLVEIVVKSCCGSDFVDF